MIGYILKTNDKTAMLALMAGLGMTYLDENGDAHFNAPPQCGFFPLTAITQRQVVDKSDPENEIIITPRVIKDGYWLLLHASTPIAAIDALTELMHCCDTQMGEFVTHCAGVTTTAITGDPVIAYYGLPSGVSCDCVCSGMAMT